MIINLAYHSISNREYAHSVNPEIFEKQMLLLKSRFSVVSVNKLLELLRLGTVDGNYATVTFDDGLEDNFTNALPVLQRLNIPTSIFFVTGLAGKLHTNPDGISSQFLSWEQALELSKTGLVTLETHTHTHPLLSEESDESIRNELFESKHLLKEKLGYDSEVLAYPKGNFDERVIRVVCPEVRAAFGTSGVLLRGERCGMYAIPRIIISKNIGMIKFWMMLHPVYWILKRLRDKYVQ